MIADVYEKRAFEVGKGPQNWGVPLLRPRQGYVEGPDSRWSAIHTVGDCGRRRIAVSVTIVLGLDEFSDVEGVG